MTRTNSKGRYSPRRVAASEPTPDATTSRSEQAERAIVALRGSFEASTGGDDLDGDDHPDEAGFDRAEAAPPDDFEMASPSGHRRDGAAFRVDLRETREL